MKHLYLIAGANGSGKSTLASVLLPAERMAYVNPDDIAREMRPSAIESIRITAGKAALKKIGELLDAGESLAIESTLSGVVYVKLLEKAKALGYEITIAYVFVDDPAACIRRIAIRVRRGGHYIPNEDVCRRYVRSKRNFEVLYKARADHWMLYYNGGSDLELVAHGNGKDVVLNPSRYELFRRDIYANNS